MVSRLSIAALVAISIGAACSGGSGGGSDLPSSISVGSKPWAVAINEQTKRLYSGNEFDNTSTAVDLETRKPISTFPVGTGPDAAAMNHQTGRVYFANAFSNDVTVVEGEQVVGTIGAGLSPWDVAVDEATNRIYVANAGSGAGSDGSVSVIDGATNAVLDTITGFAQPWGVLVHEGVLYVADANGNAVRKVDPGTGEITDSLAVGVRPRGLAVDPTTDRLYVTNVEEESVSVVDLASFSVAATVPVGLSPLEVAVNPKRAEAYVVNSLGDSVTIIDTSTNTAKATVAAGSKPWDVKVSGDGLYIYIAIAGTGQIKVYSPEQLAAVSPAP